MVSSFCQKAADSLEVDEDVFGRSLLQAQTASALSHLVVDVVEADRGPVALVPCRLKNPGSAQNWETLKYQGTLKTRVGRYLGFGGSIQAELQLLLLP